MDWTPLNYFKLEFRVYRLGCGAHVFLIDDARDPDLRGGYHLDVHAGVGQRSEHASRVSGRVSHTSPYDTDFCEPVACRQISEFHIIVSRSYLGYPL